MQRKVRRNYRHMGTAKFLALNKRIRHGLTDNPNFTDSTWGTNTTSRQEYFEAVDKYEAAYNSAINGDRVLIGVRDKIGEEIVKMLDEIASHLEAESVRNPEALLTTGFTVTNDRRSTPRTKEPLTASREFNVVNAEERGKAIGSASGSPGAFNYEIHVTDKDPAVEENWLHKGIFRDPRNMEVNNLNPGTLLFRTRPHGPEGPGPWSAIVSTTIT